MTIDRYGEILFVQTFREPLEAEDLKSIEALLPAHLNKTLTVIYNHRGEGSHALPTHPPTETLCQEFGVHFLIRSRHTGLDPWLFLDLRAGRRWLREHTKNKSILNLFAYTCSLGLTAAASGATEVLNIDFSKTHLEVGQRNAKNNSIPETTFLTLEEDCLPAMRQFAGLEAGGRRGKILKYKKLKPRQFDGVILDPPAWSKGAFGAVDVEGDYPSLFKPAVLATREGGFIMATNHVASVNFDSWVETLKKCAAKAGRPIKSLQRLTPEADFPSFDGNHPLKIVICEM